MEIRLIMSPIEREEPGEQASWAVLLSEELSELDEVRIDFEADTAPSMAKGVALSALVARIPASAVGKLVAAVRAWAARTGRTVEASIDGDWIKVTGASRTQQDEVIEAWLARHPAGT